MQARTLILGLGVLGACLLGFALTLAQQTGPPDHPAGLRLESEGPTPLPTIIVPGKSGPPGPTSPAPIEPLRPMAVPTGVVPAGRPETPVAQAEPKTGEPGPAPGTPGKQEPSVSLEWIGPPCAKVGQPADYSLLVHNTSSIPVQQVLVRVRIPTGMTITATEPRTTPENNVLVWNLETLLAHQERTLQMKLQASSTGDVMPQAWVTFTGTSVMRIRIREPKLVLKASAPPEVLIGETAAFSLTVSNPGDGSTDHVKIRAALSNGLEPPKGSDKVEFDIGDLAPGETRNVQLLCGTKAGGTEGVEVVAEADGGLSAKDTARTNVIMPRLDLAVQGPGLKFLDRRAQYTLKVTNPGNAPATNVTVAEVIPAGFKFIQASDGGRPDETSRTVYWFIGDVAPGQTREVKFEAQALAIGVHKHKAMASGARNLHCEAEAMTRVEGLSALVLEVADTEDPIEVGAETAYEVRVTNTGSQTETDIRLVGTVPDKMEFKNAQGPVRFQVQGKDIIFEPIDRLAPKAEAVFRILVKTTEPGTVRFPIRMTSTNLQDPVIKMEATRIYSDSATPEAAATRSPAPVPAPLPALPPNN